MNFSVDSNTENLLEPQKQLFLASNELLFVLPSDTANLLVEHFSEYGKEAKEVVKKAIKSFFALNDGDIVFFRDSKIIIKRIKIGSEEDAAHATVVQNNCIIFSATEVLEGTQYEGLALSLPIKEFVKHKLRLEIALKPKDAIVFMGDKVVVRRFMEHTDVEHEKIEQRGNGLPREELEIIRRRCFLNSETEKEVIVSVINECMSSEVDFKSINYSFFEKNYLKIIQKYLAKAVSTYVYEEEAIVQGIGNMILREHWALAHKMMAERLVELLAVKDANADKFIKSYSGDVAFDVDNMKYRLPEIIDENGKKWNNVSVFSLIMQYKKSQDSIEQKQKAMTIFDTKNQEFDTEIQKLVDESTSLEAQGETIEAEIVQFVDEEKKINDELKHLRTSFKSSSNESEKAKYQEDISSRMITSKRISLKQEDASNRKKQNEAKIKLAQSKIDKLRIDISQNNKKKHEEEERIASFVSTLEDVTHKFEVVLKAISSALMKKKIPIK